MICEACGRCAVCWGTRWVVIYFGEEDENAIECTEPGCYGQELHHPKPRCPECPEDRIL